MEEIKYLRDAVGQSMINIGRKDSSVVMVSADVMASCRVANFQQEMPDRSFNTGIAEQDMVSFSAGLAREGFHVYDFTMSPFLTMRACEQVRTDVAYNALNVILVGTYSGVSGGISGATHWAIEDCAIMAGIPGMTIEEPSTYKQVIKLFDYSLCHKGPMYVRVTIEGTKEFYDDSYEFEFGKASFLRDGNAGAFICSGIIVKYAMEAAERISKEIGKEIMVIDMHTVKPIDREAVARAIKTRKIITAQDHMIIGGLGSMVASVIAESGEGVKYKVVGLPDNFFPMAHAPYLYHKYGLDTEGLYSNMIQMIS